MSVDKIKEYCRRLDKHSANTSVLKDTLYKLNKMEVTVDILQKTGIGKIVSSIKKKGGTTGDMAADLIKKWRNVVDREADQEQIEDFRPAKQREEKRSENQRSDRSAKKNEKRHESHRSSKGDRHHHNDGHNEATLFSEVALVPREEKHPNSQKKPKEREMVLEVASINEPKMDTKRDEHRLDDAKSHNDSQSKAKHRKDRKRKSTPHDGEELNADFGSFEDCLGTFDPKISKKRKKSSKNSSSPKMTVTTSTLNGPSAKPKGPRLPDLLDKKPNEIQSLELPQLLTDYKPLPRIEHKQPTVKRPVNINPEAMFTSSRRDRTAVYSGRRNCTLTSVPTLFDACIRILIEHVDFIEETGGVPYDILKPIMERCTWQQLYNLEYYNPYLVEDSDPLWEVHVRKDFRGREPKKGEETWRELYLQCHDEREQKLKTLTASISQSMKDKQAPVRTTKLAYVDSMAKPPRNVQRAQLKNGTHIANRAQPSQARKIAAQASTSAATESVSGRAVAAQKKPKPAPLMAKTLSFLKMRKGYGFASR